SGSTVELTLTNTVKNDQAVTVAYTDPSGSNDSNAVQDTSGNDAASLTSTSVTNNSTVAGKELTCPGNDTTEISLAGMESGYLYGIDDDNQIFEINPQKKTTSKVFDTQLPNPKKSNGVAFHKGSGAVLFFYEQTLYSWNTTTKVLIEHDFKEGKTASAAVYGDSLWWIKSNTNQLYQLDISSLNSGGTIQDKATRYELDNYTKAGFGDIAITSDGILYGSSTGGAIGRGGLFSFDLSSIINSGNKKVNIFDHGYKLCGKTEWKSGNKTIQIGMQLALSADERVLYGQTHQNQSKNGLDTTGQYFVFRHKDSDGRFTSEIDYTDYQQSHNQLDGVGFRDIGGAASEATIIDNDSDCGKNLLKNGDFEDIEQQGTKRWWNTKTIPGWELLNDDGEVWTSGFKGIQDNTDGNNFYVELDARRKLNAISQTVTTEIGSSYTLSFDLHRRRADKNETIVVSLNDIAANSPTSGEWYTHSYSFIADSDQATIRFSELESENDSYGGLIDNVSLVKNCNTPHTPATITAAQKEDGAEVNKQIGKEDINYEKNDVLTYSFGFNKELKELQVFNFEVDFSNSTAEQTDIEQSDQWRFRADGRDNQGLVLNNNKLTVPRGAKTIEIEIPVIDDDLVEDNESLSVKMGGKSITAIIEDNDTGNVEVERIDLFNKDNGREFSDWDYNHKPLKLVHSDFVSFQIELKEPIGRASTLNFQQIINNDGRDTDKQDFKLDKCKFFTGLEKKADTRFKLKDNQLTIPGGVQNFWVEIPVNDDKVIEGTEYLTLKAGDKQATAKILDNDFVKLEAFTVLDGAEISPTNPDDPNAQLNPYLLYTIRLAEPLRQAQKIDITVSPESSADRDDLDLLEKQIIYNITDFDKTIPNASKNSTINLKGAGRIWIPIGTKEFTAKVPIKDD
ncbi:DUF642 domain-containing protein, partial [bacterium]|nr:DUF642 domain-containing protein [bacterium]